jgi:succinate dehydrogenase/fumarate reductase flavoprotein subunit
VRPDGFYLSWFGYKEGTYSVDSIAKDLKDYSQDPVSYIHTSAILNKELKEINLIEEFGNLNAED